MELVVDHERCCAFCGTALGPARPNKRFCRPACRVRSWMRDHTVPASASCVYCGAAASAAERLPGAKPAICCTECLTLLGSEPPWDLPRRKRKLKRLLRRKYARFLRGRVKPGSDEARFRSMLLARLGF